MFFKEIRTKQDLFYISTFSLSILYNSKFILMAMSLGTNAVVLTRVHCIYIYYGLGIDCLFCLFVLKFYSPVNPMGSSNEYPQQMFL